MNLADDPFSRITPEDLGYQPGIIIPGMSAQPHSSEPIQPQGFAWRDPSTIPPRPWLYGRHLLRGQVSVTVAPGGVGKSSLLLIEALSMAAGRAILGDWVAKPLTVWVYNLEDPRDELERRTIAAMIHHRVRPEEIGDRLYLNSGRDRGLCTAVQARNGAMIVAPEIEAICEAIQNLDADVVVIDPFVSSHRVQENDNGAIDMVAKEWARVAERCNCAIELVHHTRKLNGENATSEASRGAVALLGAARSARVLNRMTDDERVKAGVTGEDTYFSVTRDKANLAPAGKRAWRRIVSVDLGQGDHVGVVEPWEWPDAFDGITPQDAANVRQAVAEREIEPPREDPRSKDWVGHIVARILGLDMGEKSTRTRIIALIRTWVATEVLEIAEARSSRDGRDVRVIIPGPNDPLREGGS